MVHFIANEKRIAYLEENFKQLSITLDRLSVYTYPGERVTASVYYYIGLITESMTDIYLEDNLREKYRSRLLGAIAQYQEIYKVRQGDLEKGLHSEFTHFVEVWESRHPSPREDSIRPAAAVFFEDDTLFTRDFLELCHNGLLLLNQEANLPFYDDLRSRLHVADDDFKQLVVSMIEKGKIQPIDFESTTRWWGLIEEK
jgi:hypothetical protein